MPARFRLGSLDHVHLVVPDRAAAAAWYHQELGFEPVEAVASWTEVDGGPLHMSADGGRSGIALFQAGRGHETTTLEMGAAFSVKGPAFVRFARRLTEDDEIRAPGGNPLEAGDVVDFDHCYAFNFEDPWGNRFELNCYDVDAVKRELVEPSGIQPVRYW